MSSKDEFWNIEKLVPRKSNSTPFLTKEKVVDHYISGEERTDSERTRLSFDRVSVEAEKTYRLEGVLLRSVTVKRLVDKYDFYNNFRKAAILYYEVKTPKCEFAKFYSYMPQYSQLNVAQKNYYFYWRDCVRRGKYIETDYSYLYLYVYEILNLPDKISAADGVRILASLWREYRGALPNIDANMSVWLQDYCLVHNVQCPMDIIGDFIFDITSGMKFKEFYLNFSDVKSRDGVSAMVSYLSDYDWRGGKYAGGEGREIYEKHLLGAMGLLINKLWCGGEIVPAGLESVKLSRSAFANSLCTHSVKSTLEIEYLPLSEAPKLRADVTQALKYTENKLRALLGVKSRLAIKDLPDEYKAVIDSYFKEIFEKVNRERAKKIEPEYERLYDAMPEELSFVGADEIEKASWAITARLVEEIAEEKPQVFIPPAPIYTEPQFTEPRKESISSPDSYGLGEKELSALKAILNCNRENLRAVTGGAEEVLDSLVERINEAFADGFGDVIIEPTDAGYEIIEDYKEDVEAWLSRLMR